MLVVAFAFSLLITQVFQSYNEQQQADTLLREQVQPVLDNLEDSYRDMYQVMAAGLGMALTQSDETNSIELHRFNFYDNAPKAAPRISSVHKLVDIGFLPESSRRNIQLLERDFDTWQKRYEIMITDPANAYTFYRENEQLAEKDFESMRKLLKVIRKDIEAHRAELLAKVQDHVEGTKTMLVVGSLLALLLSAVITLVVSRLVVNPLQQLTATLKEISAGEGDLSTCSCTG
ncbi:methyl-accepting chemotaxis protein [Photobacterium aphoticum]|uniref:Methyl-accepting chemotaxis protein n=1 Tax=Photobacterium aphoticum TaxID=754436 RepID=A0A090QSQ1_9GAMM|nr:methyl-accepting chemotaxis protein [Photobacterium aphoticum]